jgi:hypothetical protein
VQLYLALIAALLCQQHLGHRPGKRLLEAIQMDQFGWGHPQGTDRGGRRSSKSRSRS